MNKKRLSEGTPFVIIAALILIIISLNLIMFTDGFAFFPLWFNQTFLGGVFTLSGAGAGAFLAGQYTLKSLEKQIEHLEKEAEKIRIANNNNALKIIDYVLEDLFAIFGFASGPFNRGNTDSEILKRGINEFNDPIVEIEKVVLDTQLLSKISEENIEKIPGEIRREISNLKDIIRVVNLHAENYSEKNVNDVSKNLARVYEGLMKIRKNIELVINR